MLLPGEIPEYRQRYSGKSAEVIVVNGNEPQIETAEVSQISEGLNGNCPLIWMTVHLSAIMGVP